MKAGSCIASVAALVLLSGSAVSADTAPAVTNIQATHHHGQTFVTWTDAKPGSDGAQYRYNVYRSLSPITNDASLAAAQLIQASLFNNSGQLLGQFPFTQTTRLDPSKRMSIVEQGSCGGPGSYTVCGNPLPPYSGLAVHTAKATAQAYYAVITIDVSQRQSKSVVSPGDNATTLAVEESVAAIVPLKYYDSKDTVHRREAHLTKLSGARGLPMWISLHGSGGGEGGLQYGDEYVYWGDSAMGYQEGLQGKFTVHEDSGGSVHGVPSLIVSPLDTVWTSDGLARLETFWFGYTALRPVAQDRTARAWPVTEARLDWLLKWAIKNYEADPARIYASGQSMGGWGISSWALRQPGLFAAVFPAMPRWRQIWIPDMQNKVTQVATTKSPIMPDGTTPYLARMDSVAYIQEHCEQDYPFIGWGIGRYDGYATWQEQVDMVNALTACRLGFAFSWNNGNHSEGPKAAAVVAKQYQTAFSRNLSYPVFTNSSLDSNPGSGDPKDGDHGE
ncbi:MAG: hypothetical protein HZB13_05120 [Acidobacteria bacterium]|nr:hypothetical protein [Acidobacteriota bacterium]